MLGLMNGRRILKISQLLLKVVARDKDHRDALTMKLTAAAHVVKVTTFETIRTSKDQSGPPITAEE